jgi:hypothetical protein
VIGDYSHIKEGYDGFVCQNQLTPDPIISHEIYSTGKTEAKYPSKWVTEISFRYCLKSYIPGKLTPHSCKIPITKDATATDAIEPAK